HQAATDDALQGRELGTVRPGHERRRRQLSAASFPGCSAAFHAALLIDPPTLLPQGQAGCSGRAALLLVSAARTIPAYAYTQRALIFRDGCRCGLDVGFGSFASFRGDPAHVRFAPDSDQIADIPEWQLRANRRHSRATPLRCSLARLTPWRARSTAKCS